MKIYFDNVMKSQFLNVDSILVDLRVAISSAIAQNYGEVLKFQTFGVIRDEVMKTVIGKNKNGVWKKLPYSSEKVYTLLYLINVSQSLAEFTKTNDWNQPLYVTYPTPYVRRTSVNLKKLVRLALAQLFPVTFYEYRSGYENTGAWETNVVQPVVIQSTTVEGFKMKEPRRALVSNPEEYIKHISAHYPIPIMEDWKEQETKGSYVTTRSCSNNARVFCRMLTLYTHLLEWDKQQKRKKSKQEKLSENLTNFVEENGWSLEDLKLADSVLDGIKG